MAARWWWRTRAGGWISSSRVGALVKGRAHAEEVASAGRPSYFSRNPPSMELLHALSLVPARVFARLHRVHGARAGADDHTQGRSLGVERHDLQARGQGGRLPGRAVHLPAG